MGISYKKLWVLLIDRDIKKSSFRKELTLVYLVDFKNPASNEFTVANQ